MESSTMQLLTKQAAKLDKSQNENTLNVIQYLEPEYNVTEHATERALELFGALVCPAAGNCKKTCLTKTGRMKMTNAINARYKRTDYLFTEPDLYIMQLKGEIAGLLIQAQKQSKRLAVRLNGTSDLNFRIIYEAFPDVQFYEYTKRKDLILKNKDLNNVHYTFSHSELTKTSVLQRVTAAGVNVSVVFADKLPDTFKNIKVIDGDRHDRRYEDQRGIIVGLKFKGSRQDRINALNSGFAV